MRSLPLFLRWSWRDLRAHWPKVLAIALVIAIGTGGYAGLTSTTLWREASYDASYEQLAMYDVRVDVVTGAVLGEGELAAVVDRLPSADQVTAVEERLIVPTQVDASTATRTVLVRGEITGSDFSDGRPSVGSYHAFAGRLLDARDAGQPRVMVERAFATFYDLADTGRIRVSGGRPLEFVGQATTPEYFSVAPENEMVMSAATFAALFATLETAQDLAGMSGRINNLVLTVADGADRDAIAGELRQALGAVPVGTTVLTRDDNLSYTALTTDVGQDRTLFNALAVLLVAGAIGSAFNLIHRLVEQQRREIGIGMALGVRVRLLALRPLLVSAEVGMLGVVLGVGVGIMIGNALAAVFTSSIPLPVWKTAFQAGLFARVAVIGLIAPFVAAILPVWRAVRVPPVAAIKPSHLTARRPSGGRRGRSAHNTFAVMPFRNLRRQRRRTALTVIAIAAALTVLVGFLGIMDSVFDAVDTAEREAEADTPNRISIGLDTFEPVGSSTMASITQVDSIAETEPVLRLGGEVVAAGTDIDVLVELSDLRAGMWRPTVSDGALTDGQGLILSEKAAADLDVTVGDTVTLRHPRRTGTTTYGLVDSQVPVIATHPHPARAFVYMDITHADLFGLDGVVNAANARPADGATVEDVQRDLFRIDRVASVQSTTAITEAVRDAFEQLVEIIQVMVVAVLLLALLIAFNTAAINLDARTREHATMFAFGVRVRTAVRMAVTESFMIGVVATIVGIAGGAVMVWWMTQQLLTETLPDFGLRTVVGGETVGVAAATGIVVVMFAPLFTVRRMRRMDVPGNLRLVE